MGAGLWEEGPEDPPSPAVIRLMRLLPGAPTGLQFTANNLPTLLPGGGRGGHDHLPSGSAFGPKASLNATTSPPSWEGEGSAAWKALSLSPCWPSLLSPRPPFVLVPASLTLGTSCCLWAPSSCCPLVSHRPLPPPFSVQVVTAPLSVFSLSVEKGGAEESSSCT